jgi:hypothetical protein
MYDDIVHHNISVISENEVAIYYIVYRKVCIPISAHAIYHSIGATVAGGARISGCRD